MGQTGTEVNLKSPKLSHVALKCQKAEKQTRLPKGLIGTKCTAQVNIAGKPCSCLFETGSQVTTVSWSFYEQHLSEQPVHSLDDLLEVEGANGQSVPYEGYIEINVTFPEFFENDVEVPTLALVVPDAKVHTESLVLIGTNTLDVLYEQYSKSKSSYHQPSPFGYRVVLKTLELRQKQTTDGHLGLVRSQSKEHAVIPAGQSVVLEGSVTSHGLHSDKWVVVQHPATSYLPGGIVVKSCLFTLPTHQPCHLPVVPTNETA